MQKQEAVSLMYLEYKKGEEVRQTPSCFLWDDKTLYVTHGAMCALFRNKYQKLEFCAGTVCVGEATAKVATHHQFIMKKILLASSVRQVKLLDVKVRRRDKHTIKNCHIAGRVADLCRVYWHGYEEGVYCVRVPITDLDNVMYWEHVSSFLLSQMGIRDWRKHDDTRERRLAVAMALHPRLGLDAGLGVLPLLSLASLLGL
jgi:hypothetical protein